jgi:hypothetical protein
MSSESFFKGILEYVHTTISTFIFPVSPPGQLISVSPRWNCMSGESSTGMNILPSVTPLYSEYDRT